MIFEELKYIYKGTSGCEKDKEFYANILGAVLIWEFKRFGTSVAAFKLGNCNHLLLIADHLDAYENIPIYRTDDLEKSVQELENKGLSFKSSKFGIPDGNCILFEDNTANKYGIYEQAKDDEYLVNEYERQQKEKSTQQSAKRL